MRNKSCLLPRLRRKDSHIKRSRQTIFEGLSSDSMATNGKIVGMEGLSACAYPAIGTVENRLRYELLPSTGKPHGIHVHDKLIVAKGSKLYAVSQSGECDELCGVSDTDKSFASFGRYLFIMPDKLCIDTKGGEVRSLNATSGLLQEATLGASYLTHPGTDFEGIGFRVGDSVEIRVEDYVLGSFAVFYRKITSISNGSLFFDVGFERSATFDVTVSLAFPDFSRMCVMGDRLVGCRESAVYLSEAGNPFNFAAFGDKDTDPVCLETGGVGEITACIPWQEVAVFFKKDSLFQLVGHGARDYLLTGMKTPGVPLHSAASLCDVCGRLYYLSDGGVYCFDGRYPFLVGDVLPQGLTDGVGGTDGKCYYFTAKDADGIWRMYACKDAKSQWFIQDMLHAASMATWGDLLFIQTQAGELLRNPRVGEKVDPEQNVITETASVNSSWVTFGEESGSSPDGLRLQEICLCVYGEGEWLSVQVSYDNSPWETLHTVYGATEGWLRLPVYPHRANAYRLRIGMMGMWRISEIVCSYEVGKQ